LYFWDPAYKHIVFLATFLFYVIFSFHFLKIYNTAEVPLQVWNQTWWIWESVLWTIVSCMQVNKFTGHSMSILHHMPFWCQAMLEVCLLVSKVVSLTRWTFSKCSTQNSSTEISHNHFIPLLNCRSGADGSGGIRPLRLRTWTQTLLFQILLFTLTKFTEYISPFLYPTSLHMTVHIPCIKHSSVSKICL
jgi:hypothetical protein